MVSERDFRVACLPSLIRDAALNIRSLKIYFPMVQGFLCLKIRDKKDSLTENFLASFVTDSTPSSLSVHFNTNSVTRSDKSSIIETNKLPPSSRWLVQIN